jgi:amino acid adenylation domain-containing protein
MSQERLWVLDQLHPQNPAQNLTCGVRLGGPFDRRTLETALDEVLRRHQILRTEFRIIDGVPAQVVLPSAGANLETTDLRRLSKDDRESQLARLAQERAQQPFNLTHGPLLRSTLFRLTDAEHVLIMILHRIICDETSAQLVLRDVASCYEACASGKSFTVAEKIVQYWEFASQQPAPSVEELAYWKEQLAGVVSSIDLPTDRQRPPVQTFRGAKQRMRIASPLLQQLRELCESQGATLFTTLFAGFNVLLSLYTGQKELLVGTPVSGRRTEMQESIGPWENMLVMRTDVSGDPSITELVQRVRKVVVDGLRHQDFPFELLVEEFHLERDLSRNPLFQVAFRLQKHSGEHLRMPSLTVSPFLIESGVERFDLSVRASEGEDGLDVEFSYNTDLFDASTIERMMQHFRRVLEHFVVDPAQHLSGLSPLTEAERDEILIEFNRTAASYPRELCIHHLLQTQAQRTPQAVAVEFNGRSLTYAELDFRSNQLSQLLRNHGVQREVLVGLCVERSLEMVVALLGILKAGGAYVPIDPAYPSDRIRHVLEDANVKILLTQESLLPSLPSTAAEVICVDASWMFLATQSGERVAAESAPEDLAYVIYTSGSTGKPKGVQIQHGSVVNFLYSMQREPGLSCDDVLVAVTTLSFDIAGLEMYLPLLSGARLVVASREQAQDGRKLKLLLQDSRATVMQATPATWRLLFESAWKGNRDLKVLVGGEALPPVLARELASGCGPVWNMYGPTETTIWSSAYRLEERHHGLIPIGKPIANTQAYILDGNHRPVPIGVPGELYLAGDGLARGYLGRPDLTNERFVPNPFQTEAGARMYRTGDVARFLPDGNILYLGRIDNQVKVRGFRIELGEIESVLSKLPSVRSAAVVAREDKPGERRLVAYVVPSSDQEFSVVRLRDFVKQSLPEYMVPSTFVKMDTLPLSPNGKINRSALPAPDSSQAEGSTTVVARDDLELELVNIWKKVLGVPNVGITDNFFDLGGHSLLAARMLCEIEMSLGKEIPLSALFRSATVESLAALIREAPKSGPDPFVMQIQPGTGGLPFFAIVAPREESLGYAMLARHMGPDQAVYKIQANAPVVGKRPYTEEEMCRMGSEYVAAIRTVQQEGPYCLGGLCDGAHIAERVILELEAQGHHVGLFAIIDTWVLQNSQRRWLWRLSYFQQRLREINSLSLAEQFQVCKRGVTNQIRRLTGNAPVRTEWQATYWPDNYTPTVFRAPVVLFKRPKQPFFYVKDPQMGWGARTESGVEIHEIDFDHVQLLREPHVRALGEKLVACIGRVNSQSGSPPPVREQSRNPEQSVMSSGRAG